jgi:DNA-3-methyladenine glycosylase II
MKPDYWSDAISHLSKVDYILCEIIKKNQHQILISKNNPFNTLIKSILGQQISVKAAQSIYGRLLELVENDISPSKITAINKEDLRRIGLSRQKIEYINNISDHFINNPRNTSNSYFLSSSKDEIYNNLINIKGVGEWTIEMFFIFYMTLPDIMPFKDIGLINAIKKAYNLVNLDKKTEYESILNISDKWRPYRTVATWYLWQMIDDELVEY